jgi:large subunit ribosomal protein L10
MRKLGLIFKETLENRVKDYLKESNSIFVITYSKLSSPDLTALRQALRNSKATLFVAKNSVVRRALKNNGLEFLSNLVHGPCGLIFTKDEPVSTSKVLCDFSRDHEQLKLEGGSQGNRLLEIKEIQAMAKLPPKEILRAQVVMGLKSPIFSIVAVLKGNLRKIVYCLEQINNAKAQKNN